MMSQRIPVVFSADNYYATYLGVTLHSLIKNTSKEREYDIFILSTNIDYSKQKILCNMSKPNINISVVDISDIVSNVDLKESLHLSVEAYYRLFIPLILPQYEKVIYIDTDTLIQHDIAELYDIDMGEKPLGAVQDVVCSYLDEHCLVDLELDCRKCINSGVLLINTFLFEKFKIREKCLEVLSIDYKRERRRLIFADQDALNIVLYDDFYLLPDCWNFQWQYLWRMDSVYDEYKNAYIENGKKPYILHYAGDMKPWEYPELVLADRFWECSLECGLLSSVLQNTIKRYRNTTERLLQGIKYRFPYDAISRGSRVAIYAAGDVGKTFYYHLLYTKYADVVIMVDRKYDKFSSELYRVYPIDELMVAKYDYLIIAIINKGVSESIKYDLIQMGIPESKIIWEDYRL